MREWMRARWRYLALGAAVVLAWLVWLLRRAQDRLRVREDARTDRKLDRSHEGHIRHEGAANALEARAEELEARAEELEARADLSQLSAEQVAAEFKRISSEREKQ